MNLRNLDAYKVIVLVAAVALPLGWWQVKKLDGEIAACVQTIAAAKRPGGLIEEIGQLQRKVEVVVQNKRSMSDSIKDPRTYFQGQLLQSGSQLKVNDFSLQDARPEQATLASKQPVTDFVIAIDWPNKKDLPVGLDFLYAAIFNCESGASAVSEAAQQSVWRLRDLRVVNLEAMALTGGRVPPPELPDKWIIEEMKFARREPRKGK